MPQSPRSIERAGGIALPALIALPVILTALVAGLSSCQFVDITTRMQIEADASSLAGVGSLTGDALLRARYQPGINNSELFSLLQSSLAQVQNYAKLNPVYGGYSTPNWNLTTPTSGDVIFGHYDRTQSTPFSPLTLQDSMGNPSSDLYLVNSVRVFMRRNHSLGDPIPVLSGPFSGLHRLDVAYKSTAMLDGDVIGFRPLFPDVTLPLVPIALDAATVRTQTTPPFPSDSLKYNGSNGFVSGSDNLPEVTIYLTTSTPPAGVKSTAALLFIGTSGTTDIANQITSGVAPAQLAGNPFNGAFILTGSLNFNELTLDVPGSSSFNAGDQSTLESALNTVAQTPSRPRIWPLFSGYDRGGDPTVIGFIAMRLIAAQEINDNMGSAIKLTMQPTLMAEPTTVTNPKDRGYIGVPNLTIAKVRLVP